MPLWLINWRLWAVLAFAAAEAFAGYKLHHAGYEEGKAEVQQEFTLFKEQALEQALAAQIERQAKESAMSASNQEVTANYVSLQAATSVAVRALDVDRMRLQAALAASRHSGSQDPGAGLSPDDTPQDGILGQCIDRYAAVAGDADQLSSQVTALQAYVAGVCQGAK